MGILSAILDAINPPTEDDNEEEDSYEVPNDVVDEGEGDN